MVEQRGVEADGDTDDAVEVDVLCEFWGLSVLVLVCVWIRVVCFVLLFVVRLCLCGSD